MSLRKTLANDGSLNRWKAQFGLTEPEVVEARAISKKLKIHMHEACRIVFRDVSRRASA